MFPMIPLYAALALLAGFSVLTWGGSSLPVGVVLILLSLSLCRRKRLCPAEYGQIDDHRRNIGFFVLLLAIVVLAVTSWMSGLSSESPPAAMSVGFLLSVLFVLVTVPRHPVSTLQKVGQFMFPAAAIMLGIIGSSILPSVAPSDSPNSRASATVPVSTTPANKQAADRERLKNKRLSEAQAKRAEALRREAAKAKAEARREATAKKQTDRAKAREENARQHALNKRVAARERAKARRRAERERRRQLAQAPPRQVAPPPVAFVSPRRVAPPPPPPPRRRSQPERPREDRVRRLPDINFDRCPYDNPGAPRPAGCPSNPG